MPSPWKPDKGHGQKETKPTEGELWEKHKEGVGLAVHKGKQGQPDAQPSFVLPCTAYLERRCRYGSMCKYSHSSFTSLSDDEYHQFIRMACPVADQRDVEYLWSLSKSERLAVVNEGKIANVDDIKLCCEERISRASNGSKRAKVDPHYEPPPGGNQAAAALAAAVAPDPVAGAPADAVSAAGTGLMSLYIRMLLVARVICVFKQAVRFDLLKFSMSASKRRMPKQLRLLKIVRFLPPGITAVPEAALGRDLAL